MRAAGTPRSLSRSAAGASGTTPAGWLPSKLVSDLLVWALLLTMPFWLPHMGGYTELGTRIVILGLGAMALNFLLGFTGVLSFGHAAYFGLGAYGAGLTLKYLLSSSIAALAVGVAAAALAGAVLGALIVRLRGVYFAMVTIAFGQVFYFIAFRWNSVTGGDDGLRGFSRQPIGFGNSALDITTAHPVVFYYFVLFFFALAAAAMAGLLRSPLGRTLLAIRENERRARFLGLPIEQHIWISFVISCFFVGLAGALNAFLDNFANPGDLHWQFSGNLVIMVVLGGMRSFWGPLLGAAFFVALQDYLSSMTQNWMSFVGILFVLVVLFFPRGILGFTRRGAA
jgi:branched-chain amino acid transport system permease protein